jgi:hypothetical protein
VGQSTRWGRQNGGKSQLQVGFGAAVPKLLLVCGDSCIEFQKRLESSESTFQAVLAVNQPNGYLELQRLTPIDTN